VNMIALLLAATLSSGITEFEATARNGARDISLSRAREKLREEGPERGVLKKAMLADPKKFEKPDEAETLCRDIFADELRAQFAAKARAIDERLGIESDKVLDAGTVDEIVNRHFASAFASERKAAVETQAKTIVTATRPTEAEFDEKSDDELRAQMLQSILEKQKTALFSENHQYVRTGIVESVIKEAREEQKRQAEYLMRARCDTAAPSKLRADLKALLEEDVKKRSENEDGQSKKWGVFAGTFEKSVGPEVERRALDRLETKINATSVEVDVDSILKEIVEAPQKHVKQAESEKVFASRYSAALLARALDGTCDDAPQSERDELREYLSSRLGGERIQKAVEAKVKKDVLPKWREARATAAKRQADDTWPTLADGTWFPQADLADDVTARIDYAKSVKEWRSLAALKILADAPKGRPLMEEADSRADSEVAAAFDIARRAIAKQNAIVDECHKPVLAEAKKRKDSFWTRTPDLKTVVELLTHATEESWDASRLDTLWPDEAKRPANADEQHKALFPSVRRKIELLARTILEEMNEPKQENEEKPEEALELAMSVDGTRNRNVGPLPNKQAAEPPKESKEDSPDDDLKILVSCVGNEVEVSLKRGETVFFGKKVPARKDDFKNVMIEVANEYSRKRNWK